MNKLAELTSADNGLLGDNLMWTSRRFPFNKTMRDLEEDLRDNRRANVTTTQYAKHEMSV